ncbi:VanZ family protein [Novosphingobium sp. B 225]|uniref:VanZ family protein n=1 Tax=Novosphingobium sp. B 225 TaxID=1961849 RepID=UPI0020CE8D20|nr:VanZ family protein [Novosphingobium sp. B 225]
MKPVTLLRTLVVVFWLAMAFTLVMALLPQSPSVPFKSSDKVQHMVAFAALSLLACFAFPGQRLRTLFVSLASLGGAIEILQMIPVLHRDAEFADWLADCFAIALVMGIAGLGRRTGTDRLA